MNAWLNKAIAALSKLPDAEQEAIAREMLDRFEADTQWDKLLSDPRSKSTLARLAAEARSDIKSGDVFNRDPSIKTSE